jgi:hypothetical protein
MQISIVRGSEEPNGITRKSDERVVKVNWRTFFAKDCNLSVHI